MNAWRQFTNSTENNKNKIFTWYGTLKIISDTNCGKDSNRSSAWLYKRIDES